MALLAAMALACLPVSPLAQNAEGQVAGPSHQAAGTSAGGLQKADSRFGSVEVVLITALASALGWFVSHGLTTRREDRTKRLQLSIDQSEKQIGEFYAPLIYLLEQLDTLDEVKERIQEADRDAVSEIMYREYFLPIHQEIISILKTKIHLLEGATIPDNLLNYFRHFTSENLAWRVTKENIQIWGTVAGFPEEFPAELKKHQQMVYLRYESALQELRHEEPASRCWAAVGTVYAKVKNFAPKPGH